MAAEDQSGADSDVSSALSADASFAEVGRRSQKDRLFGKQMRETCWAQADVVGTSLELLPVLTMALFFLPFFSRMLMIQVFVGGMKCWNY
jgi:hypothetical protein